jgi:hypothetical protein
MGRVKPLTKEKFFLAKLAAYEKAKTEYERIRKKMEAGTATEAEIGIESVSDMDLAGRENELRHLSELLRKGRGKIMWNNVKEKFFYQFEEQLKGLVKLVPDPDLQDFIIDGCRVDAKTVVEVLKGLAGFSPTENSRTEITLEDDGFIFYSSFFEALEGLPDDSYIRLSKCILSFGIKGVETELQGIEKNIFAPIRQHLVNQGEIDEQS